MMQVSSGASEIGRGLDYQDPPRQESSQVVLCENLAAGLDVMRWRNVGNNGNRALHLVNNLAGKHRRQTHDLSKTGRI